MSLFHEEKVLAGPEGLEPKRVQVQIDEERMPQYGERMG